MIKWIKNFFKRIAFLWKFSKDPMTFLNTQNSKLWDSKFKSMNNQLKNDVEKKFDELEKELADILSKEVITRLNMITDKAKKLIGDRTQVHANISWQNNPHEIIVIGRYNGKDYVRVYHLHANDWKNIVNHLKTLEQHAVVGRIDTPGSMPFQAVYDKERF